jgi:1,5-anhydro-D-fructose reductase (1,5-anhydro-D-mannitol-forming)
VKQVNYALIGFGGIAETRIAREGFACGSGRVGELPEAVLLGAADVNPARREAVTALGLRWYENLDEVLADPAVNAVFIATNNLTHAGTAKKAMQAGRHVLVEKPMATDCSDAEELCSLAREKNLSLGVDHMMIENVYNRKARELVADGALGAVNDSRFHMEFLFGLAPEEAVSWRCSKMEEMGGPVGDVASHCLYVAEYLFNSRITELACVYYPKGMAIQAEDGAYLAFRLATGMTGSVQVSFCSPRGGLKATLNNLGYEIFGDQAVLRGYGTLFQMSGFPEDPVPVRLELDRFTERIDVQPDRIENIYQRVIQKHARSILENNPMDGHEGYHNLQLISAAHESARGGGVWLNIENQNKGSVY